MKITNLLSDEAIISEFGRRIANLRVQREMTQADVAQEAGLSKRTVENIENGATVQMTSIIRVLRVLQLMDRLDQVIPESRPRPMEILKQKRKIRVRSSGKKANKENHSKPWAWKE